MVSVCPQVLLVVQPDDSGPEPRYRVGIGGMVGLPFWGPPTQQTFPRDETFVNYLLTKCINGQRATCVSEEFTIRERRTRNGCGHRSFVWLCACLGRVGSFLFDSLFFSSFFPSFFSFFFSLLFLLFSSLLLSSLFFSSLFFFSLFPLFFFSVCDCMHRPVLMFPRNICFPPSPCQVHERGV